jgi:hypothetical protein
VVGSDGEHNGPVEAEGNGETHPVFGLHLEEIMVQLTLLRHGESIWNRDNRFTGWTDVDLSDKGVGEAHRAAGCARPLWAEPLPRAALVEGAGLTFVVSG